MLSRVSGSWAVAVAETIAERRDCPPPRNFSTVVGGFPLAHLITTLRTMLLHAPPALDRLMLCQLVQSRYLIASYRRFFTHALGWE